MQRGLFSSVLFFFLHPKILLQFDSSPFTLLPSVRRQHIGRFEDIAEGDNERSRCCYQAVGCLSTIGISCSPSLDDNFSILQSSCFTRFRLHPLCVCFTAIQPTAAIPCQWVNAWKWLVGDNIASDKSMNLAILCYRTHRNNIKNNK